MSGLNQTRAQESKGDAGELFAANPVRNLYGDVEAMNVIDQMESLPAVLGTLLIARAAEEDGASINWVSDQTCIASHPQRQVMIWSHRGVDSPVGNAIESDKLLTKMLMEANGVSTPKGDLASSPEEAVKIFRDLARPVVTKPRFGAKGKGISVGLSTEDEVKAGFLIADNYGVGTLVEEAIEGEELRCIGTSDECLSVVGRIRPNVLGDGESSIAELINRKNEDRRRNPHLRNRLIPNDDVMRRVLASQGLDETSIPSVGEVIHVRDVGSFSQGGESYECSSDVDETLKACARNAIDSIPGLLWGGVDLLVSNDTGRPYVLEINADAGLGGHAYPVFGMPKSVARRNWELRKSQGSVPDEPPVPAEFRRFEPPSKREALGQHVPRSSKTRSVPSRLHHAIHGYLRDKGEKLERLGGYWCRESRSRR